MVNTIVIKIESGVVADFYSTAPTEMVIVDYDLIEGDETFEARMKKAVLEISPDGHVRPEDIAVFVKSLVSACDRPRARFVKPDIFHVAAGLANSHLVCAETEQKYIQGDHMV